MVTGAAPVGERLRWRSARTAIRFGTPRGVRPARSLQIRRRPRRRYRHTTAAPSDRHEPHGRATSRWRQRNNRPRRRVDQPLFTIRSRSEAARSTIRRVDARRATAARVGQPPGGSVQSSTSRRDPSSHAGGQPRNPAGRRIHPDLAARLGRSRRRAVGPRQGRRVDPASGAAPGGRRRPAAVPGRDPGAHVLSRTSRQHGDALRGGARRTPRRWAISRRPARGGPDGTSVYVASRDGGGSVSDVGASGFESARIPPMRDRPIGIRSHRTATRPTRRTPRPARRAPSAARSRCRSPGPARASAR